MNDVVEVAEPAGPIKIHTIAPIPMADLRRKFSEDVEYVIDYANSKHKGKALITYLSNLAIRCTIDVTDFDEACDLLAVYMEIPTLVDLPDLEDFAFHMMLAFNGKVSGLDFDPAPFIEKHREILTTWKRRLDSLPLFALHTTGKYADYIKSFPEDTDSSLAGINFVNMMKHPEFVFYTEGADQSTYTWNEKFFNEYIFAGKNMFHFFAVPTNPLFIGILALQDADSFKSMADAIEHDVAELSRLIGEVTPNVPSV
jgi:hypothetical protein